MAKPQKSSKINSEIADEESAIKAPMPIFNSSPQTSGSSSRRSGKCFVYVLLVIVVVASALLAFSMTVLRVKPISLRIDTITVKSLRFDGFPSFDITLNAGISIRNRNYGQLKLETGRNRNLMNFLYMNANGTGFVVGEAKLKLNEVGAKKEEKESVEVKVSSIGLQLPMEDKQEMMNQINKGKLELRSYANWRGKVNLLKKIKKSTNAELNCTVSFDLRNQAVERLIC